MSEPNGAVAPAKPKPKTKKACRRRRAVRIEDNPDVREWCENFVKQTQDEHGYTPTEDQATSAFLVAALKALGRGWE